MDFSMQSINPETLFSNPPNVVLRGIYRDMYDRSQAMWVAMAALAEDVYKREDGPREFEKFVKSIGLRLNGLGDKKLMLGEYLEGVKSPKSSAK